MTHHRRSVSVSPSALATLGDLVLAVRHAFTEGSMEQAHGALGAAVLAMARGLLEPSEAAAPATPGSAPWWEVARSVRGLALAFPSNDSMELGSFVLEELLLSLPRPSFVGSLAHEGLPDAAQPEGIFAGRGHGSVAFELASELDFEPLSGDNYEEGPTALAD